MSRLLPCTRILAAAAARGSARRAAPTALGAVRYTRPVYSAVPSRFFSSETEPDDQKEKEDQQLQEAYDGLFPKLRIIKDLFFNDEARDILYKTLQATTRTFGRPVQMPTVPLKLYTDLQNPLLQKYKFDPDDFLEGAEMALSTVTELVDASKLSEEASAALLDDISLGDVKMGFMAWRQLVSEGKAVPEDVKIKGIFLTGVETEIVDRDHEEVVSGGLPDLGAVVATTGPGLNNDIPDDNESMLDLNKSFPNGSVVATVKIDAIFLKGEEGPEEKEVFPGMIGDDAIMVMLDFKGCISGQKDLEWKISKVIFSHPLVNSAGVNTSGENGADTEASSSDEGSAVEKASSTEVDSTVEEKKAGDVYESPKAEDAKKDEKKKEV